MRLIVAESIDSQNIVELLISKDLAGEDFILFNKDFLLNDKIIENDWLCYNM